MRNLIKKLTSKEYQLAITTSEGTFYRVVEKNDYKVVPFKKRDGSTKYFVQVYKKSKRRYEESFVATKIMLDYAS